MPTISLRITQEAYDRITRQAQERRITRSQLIREKLEPRGMHQSVDKIQHKGPVLIAEEPKFFKCKYGDWIGAETGRCPNHPGKPIPV